MLSIWEYVIGFLIACLLVQGWQLRRAQRRIDGLEDELAELDAELRLADRKLRRAEQDLRQTPLASREDPSDEDQ